jgi:8-oxo-dGTP pyrophosphatase MutT (NUDIX family)
MRTLPRLLYLASRAQSSLLRRVTIGARLIITVPSGLVLVKHAYQRDWYLPGGGVSRGETPEEAARREAQEELGGTLGDLSLFGVYSSFAEGRSDHVIVFACSEAHLAGAQSSEIAEWGIFPFDALPDGLSPGTRRRVDEYLSEGPPPFVGRW